MRWLWLWTGHRLAHRLGIQRDWPARRPVPTKYGVVEVLGWQCQTCGEWNP